MCDHEAGHCCLSAQLASTPHPPPTSNAHPTQLPAAAAAALLLRGVTPGHFRRHADTGEARGEGHNIQPDGLKLSKKMTGSEWGYHTLVMESELLLQEAQEKVTRSGTFG